MSNVANVNPLAGKKLHDGMIKSRKTKIGNYVIAAICFILMLSCLLPMLHVLSASLSSPDAMYKKEVYLFPKGWNTSAYNNVLNIDGLHSDKYLRSLGFTAILTIGCTLLSITLTICTAYPLTYDNLKGGKLINVLIIFTMYFSAGTIPMYMLLSNLNMVETPWALVFPNCISVFNVIIMRSFFYGVPSSLREAAEIDGAGPIRTLIQVYLPLSLPVIATLSLFYAVGRWNGFSDALIYLKTPAAQKDYSPIQLLLYNLIKNSTPSNDMLTQEVGSSQEIGQQITVQMATVMFATVPILLVYPWLQRYFVSGVTIGAVKG